MPKKRALVTGVTSGIGREFALGLVRLGYDLIVIARNEAKVADLRREAVTLRADIELDFHHADLSLVASTQAAVEFLLSLFQQDSPYIFRHRLEAGEGVISNNALHCRTGFSHEDGEASRLLYRARYFDRVADSERGR